MNKNSLELSENEIKIIKEIIDASNNTEDIRSILDEQQGKRNFLFAGKVVEYLKNEYKDYNGELYCMVNSWLLKNGYVDIVAKLEFHSEGEVVYNLLDFSESSQTEMRDYFNLMLKTGNKMLIGGFIKKIHHRIFDYKDKLERLFGVVSKDALIDKLLSLEEKEDGENDAMLAYKIWGAYYLSYSDLEKWIEKVRNNINNKEIVGWCEYFKFYNDWMYRMIKFEESGDVPTEEFLKLFREEYNTLKKNAVFVCSNKYQKEKMIVAQTRFFGKAIMMDLDIKKILEIVGEYNVAKHGAEIYIKEEKFDMHTNHIRSMDIEETFFSFGFEKRYTPEDKIYIFMNAGCFYYMYIRKLIEHVCNKKSDEYKKHNIGLSERKKQINSWLKNNFASYNFAGEIVHFDQENNREGFYTVDWKNIYVPFGYDWKGIWEEKRNIPENNESKEKEINSRFNLLLKSEANCTNCKGIDNHNWIFHKVHKKDDKIHTYIYFKISGVRELGITYDNCSILIHELTPQKNAMNCAFNVKDKMNAKIFFDEALNWLDGVIELEDNEKLPELERAHTILEPSTFGNDIGKEVAKKILEAYMHVMYNENQFIQFHNYITKNYVDRLNEYYYKDNRSYFASKSLQEEIEKDKRYIIFKGQELQKAYVDNRIKADIYFNSVLKTVYNLDFLFFKNLINREGLYDKFGNEFIIPVRYSGCDEDGYYFNSRIATKRKLCYKKTADAELKQEFLRKNISLFATLSHIEKINGKELIIIDRVVDKAEVGRFKYAIRCIHDLKKIEKRNEVKTKVDKVIGSIESDKTEDNILQYFEKERRYSGFVKTLANSLKYLCEHEKYEIASDIIYFFDKRTPGVLTQESLLDNNDKWQIKNMLQRIIETSFSEEQYKYFVYIAKNTFFQYVMSKEEVVRLIGENADISLDKIEKIYDEDPIKSRFEERE